MLGKINDNVYMIDLPPAYGVHDIFNVVDLKAFPLNDDHEDSRTNHFQEGRMM